MSMAPYLRSSSGGMNFKGYPLRWRHMMSRMAIEFDYMGERYCFSEAELHSRPDTPLDWADYVYHNNQRSMNRGLSGKAAQAISSHPVNPLAGYGGGNSSAAQQAIINQVYAAAIGGGGGGGTAPEVKHEPLKIDGIKLGEIIAFRGWRVTAQGFLRSMSADVIWGPGEPMEGKTESKREHNGVYAYKTARDFLKEHATDLDVYGKVALWGDIIEHELGYRAQFAKVVSLEHYLKREAPHKISIKELRQKYCPKAEAA